MALHGAPAPPERPGHFEAVAARGPWESPDRVLEDGEPIELEGACSRPGSPPATRAGT